MVQRITVTASQHHDQRLLLTKEQRHYLITVLRLKAGDRFIAQDGSGRQWLAALESPPSQTADIIEQLSEATATAPLRLIAALPKGNGFDQVVRQTTELGVTHIYPVMSARSLLKPSANKLARWQRIAQEASEQCERLTIPEIFSPVDFKVCLQQLERERKLAVEQRHTLEQRYVCAARGLLPHLLMQLLNNSNATTGVAETMAIDKTPGRAINESENTTTNATFDATVNVPSVTLAIGPEGGWTTHEITDAINYGYEAVSLGSAILRSVTAPITALSLVTAARETLI